MSSPDFEPFSPFSMEASDPVAPIQSPTVGAITPLKCANWFTVAAGKCVSVTQVTPLADALQFFIDWITIIGCALFIILFLNRLIGFYNRKCENIDKHSMWNNYFCRACILLIVGCACGFMSKMLSFMNLKANPFMLTFNALWSQSYVIVWLAVGLVQLHFIEIWVVRFKDLNLNRGQFRYSWVVIAAALLLTALSVIYDLYINIITDKYKSQNPKYVRIGWILMSLPYMQLCVLASLMFPIAKKLRYTKGALLGETINVSSTIIIVASAFSVIVIYFFEFYPAGLSLYLNILQAKTTNAVIRSYVIRLLVLLCNYAMLGACVYALSFASYVQIPIIGEIYYLARPEARSKVYAKERMMRAEMGYTDWSTASSNKDSHPSSDGYRSSKTLSSPPVHERSRIPPSPPPHVRRHDYSRTAPSPKSSDVENPPARPAHDTSSSDDSEVAVIATHDE